MPRAYYLHGIQILHNAAYSVCAAGIVEDASPIRSINDFTNALWNAIGTAICTDGELAGRAYSHANRDPVIPLGLFAPVTDGELYPSNVNAVTRDQVDTMYFEVAAEDVQLPMLRESILRAAQHHGIAALVFWRFIVPTDDNMERTATDLLGVNWRGRFRETPGDSVPGNQADDSSVFQDLPDFIPEPSSSVPGGAHDPELPACVLAVPVAGHNGHAGKVVDADDSIPSCTGWPRGALVRVEVVGAPVTSRDYTSRLSRYSSLSSVVADLVDNTRLRYPYIVSVDVVLTPDHAPELIAIRLADEDGRGMWSGASTALLPGRLIRLGGDERRNLNRWTHLTGTDIQAIIDLHQRAAGHDRRLIYEVERDGDPVHLMEWAVAGSRQQSAREFQAVWESPDSYVPDSYGWASDRTAFRLSWMELAEIACQLLQDCPEAGPVFRGVEYTGDPTRDPSGGQGPRPVPLVMEQLAQAGLHASDIPEPRSRLTRVAVDYHIAASDYVRYRVSLGLEDQPWLIDPYLDALPHGSYRVTYTVPFTNDEASRDYSFDLEGSLTWVELCREISQNVVTRCFMDAQENAAMVLAVLPMHVYGIERRTRSPSRGREHVRILRDETVSMLTAPSSDWRLSDAEETLVAQLLERAQMQPQVSRESHCEFRVTTDPLSGIWARALRRPDDRAWTGRCCLHLGADGEAIVMVSPTWEEVYREVAALSHIAEGYVCHFVGLSQLYVDPSEVPHFAPRMRILHELM